MSSKSLILAIAAVALSVLPASADGGRDPLTRWLDKSLRKDSAPAQVAPSPAAGKPALVVADEAADAGAAAGNAGTTVIAASDSVGEEALVARLSAYFNGIGTLTANFVQTNADGRKVSGTLALKRPGEFRFAYAAPSTLEIVSDGRKVAIRDSRLKTNDVYPLDKTPLKFLAKDRLDLARDTRITGVAAQRDGSVLVKFEDGSTFGGTSRVELDFDPAKDSLKGWTIIDPQGYRTEVRLSDIVIRPGS